MDDLIHSHNNNYLLMDDRDDAEVGGDPHQARLTLPDLLPSSGGREVIGGPFICTYRDEPLHTDIYYRP